MAKSKVTQGLTRSHEKELIKLLGLVGQPWSVDFFNAVKHQVVMTAIEVAIMRGGTFKPQIILIKRPITDKYWPGQLHSPGSMLRESDVPAEDFRNTFQRILGEIGVTTFKSPPILVDAWPVATRRGPENANLHIAEINGEPGIGKFWDIDEALALPVDVPDGLIPEHVKILKLAAHH